MVITVIVLSLVFTVFVQHMLKIFALAERSLLSNTVININTALNYRVADHFIRGDYGYIEQMTGINPMEMINAGTTVSEMDTAIQSPINMLAFTSSIQLPANYIGEIENPDPETIEGGSWYFNTVERTLVYRVDNAEYFHSSLAGEPRVVFYVNIDYEDTNNNNRFDTNIDKYQRIYLKSDHEYAWQL